MKLIQNQKIRMHEQLIGTWKRAMWRYVIGVTAAAGQLCAGRECEAIVAGHPWKLLKHDRHARNIENVISPRRNI